MMKRVFTLVLVCLVIGVFCSAAIAVDKEAIFSKADAAYDGKDHAAVKAGIKELEPLIASDEAAAWRYARACYDVGVNLTDKKAKDNIFKKGYRAVEPFYVKGTKSVDTNYWFALVTGKYASFHKLDAVKSGLTKKMKDACNKVIKANPDYEDGNAYTVLGAIEYELYMLPIYKGNLDVAVKSFKKALTYDSDNIFVNMTLGKTYYEKEMYKAAKASLEKSLKGKPGNKDDRDYQAEAREYLKKVEKKMK